MSVNLRQLKYKMIRVLVELIQNKNETVNFKKEVIYTSIVFVLMSLKKYILYINIYKGYL